MREYLDTYRELLDQMGKHQYTCMFGVGVAADSYWYRFVTDLGYEIDFFSDNNPALWKQNIIDNLVCISPKELLKYGRKVLCLVAVSALYTSEIAAQLTAMGLDVIALDQRWFRIKEVIERYTGIQVHDDEYTEGAMGDYDREIDEKERIAVYTCIIDNYDDLKQPKVIDRQCDYYCLSLEEPSDTGIFQWIDISAYFEGTALNPTKINRFCKMHPHLFFGNYRYSLYLDGSFEITNSVTDLMRKIGTAGIGLCGKELRGGVDAYGETAWTLLSGKTSGDRREILVRQMERYAQEGFPRNYGSAACGVIAREHANSNCIQIMESWWREIANGSGRDEISFFYAVWINGFAPSAIGRIGSDVRDLKAVNELKHTVNVYQNNFIYQR